MIISKIEGAVAEKNYMGAAVLIEDNFDSLSSNKTAFILAIDVYRKLNNKEKALLYSERLMQSFPGYFEAYIRFSQELLANGESRKALKIAKLGLKKFPSNKWILLAVLKSASQENKCKLAIKLGQRLTKNYPKFIQGYTGLSEAFASKKDFNSSLNTLLNGLSRFDAPSNYLEKIFDLYLACNKHIEYSQFLLHSLKKYPQHALLISRRLATLGSVYPKIQRRPAIKKKNCDVLCIASDEEAYVAEFIHHYIFLGFSNIYVGVNNITDETLFVLKKIASHYNNVFILDVDLIQREFKQAACYSYLYQYAKSRSDSQYYLIVDVDEFWVADKFPTSVNAFLGKNAPFDVFSFQWVNQLNESFFTPPLSKCIYRPNPNVKSMISYDTLIRDFQIHAPILINYDKFVVKQGRQVNAYLEIHDWTNTVSINQKIMDSNFTNARHRGLGWIFHRIHRSELEYSLKCFKVHANDDPNVNLFKTNRGGLFAPKVIQLDQDFFSEILPSRQVERYHRSLDQFIKKCGLDSFLSSKRGEVSVNLITSKINKIPEDVLNENRDLLRTIFKGTRFISRFK